MSKLNLSSNRINNKRNQVNELDFDVDVRYIKGLYDAFRFVGGEINNQEIVLNQISSSDTSKMLQNIGLFKKSEQSTETSELKLDLLTMKDTLTKTNLRLKSANGQLLDKKEEIDHLRHELERKNILIDQKNIHIAQLNEERSWSKQLSWQNTSEIRAELKEMKDKLKDARDEINVLRHELEQRNICINMQDKRSTFFR